MMDRRAFLGLLPFLPIIGAAEARKAIAAPPTSSPIVIDEANNVTIQDCHFEVHEGETAAIKIGQVR